MRVRVWSLVLAGLLVLVAAIYVGFSQMRRDEAKPPGRTGDSQNVEASRDDDRSDAVDGGNPVTTLEQKTSDDRTPEGVVRPHLKKSRPLRRGRVSEPRQRIPTQQLAEPTDQTDN